MDREVPPQERLTPDFAARREAARAKLDAIDPHRQEGGAEADPLRRDWFEAVYRLADGDAACVPWGDLAPHPLLADWLAGQGSLAGLRALDVGCGLGDNAEALAAAGAKVHGLRFRGTAIGWAKRRFPQSAVDYRAEDLFALPDGMARRRSTSCMSATRCRRSPRRCSGKRLRRWPPWLRPAGACSSSPGRARRASISPGRPGR